MKRLTLLVTLSMLFALTGCEVAKRDAVHVSPDAIHMEKDALHVEKDAMHVEKDAVDIKTTTTLEKDSVLHTEPGTIVLKTAPKTVCVEKDAFHIVFQEGSFVMQPNAITINMVLGQKPPPIEKPEIKGIRPLADSTIVKNVPDTKLAEDIINNETIYKAIIDTLLKRIDLYNKDYAKVEPQK